MCLAQPLTLSSSSLTPEPRGSFKTPLSWTERTSTETGNHQRARPRAVALDRWTMKGGRRTPARWSWEVRAPVTLWSPLSVCLRMTDPRSTQGWLRISSDFQ